MARRLTAILVADMVGYSRLMAADEARTIDRLKSLRRDIIDPEIARGGGEIVKLTGDGMIVLFDSIVDAVEAAASIQKAVPDAGFDHSDPNQMIFRIGLHVGDVVLDEDEIYGDGVNIAARLEATAEPGGVVLSEDAYRHVRGKTELSFSELGELKLKNIPFPVRAFKIDLEIQSMESKTTTTEDQRSEWPSIAVLPFENMSADPEQDYFADGIATDIVTELSRFSSLFVIASNSSFQFKDSAADVRWIGRELGVDFIVEGSVRRAGARIRLTAQLVDVSTGKHLWAERYDRQLEEIFDLQDELAREVATAVPGRLDATAAQAARRKPASSMSAYDHYLRARWILDRDFRSPEAATHLKKAIEIDPRCARALVTLAGYLTYNAFLKGFRSDETSREAVRLIDLAVESDPTDAVVLAVASESIAGIDPKSALRYAETALQLNPNDITVINYASAVLSHHGEHERAIQLLEKSLRHDPLRGDSYRHADFHVYYAAGLYEDAIKTLDGWGHPPVILLAEAAAAYAQLGLDNEAAISAAKFRETAPKDFNLRAQVELHLQCKTREADRTALREGFLKAGFEI